MRTISFLGLLVGALAYAPRNLDARVIPNSSHADTSSAHIVAVTGRVIDDLTAPLDNALVEVSSPATGRTFSARTNANGQYTVRAVGAAPHLDVVVRRIGFRPAHFVLVVGSSDFVVGNLQMLPIAPVVIL